MNSIANRVRNTAFHRWYKRNEKYAPILFFIGGFIFDSLTLGRIDRLYDITVLCLYMLMATFCLYLYNKPETGRWRSRFAFAYRDYLPLAIQFFFGGLSSAYVIYFSRSVSLSKTASFFVILVLLFFANELLRNRISNRYMQFGMYSFISFTFFAFMIPVFMRKMSETIFLISGMLSLACTLLLLLLIFRAGTETGRPRHFIQLTTLIFLVYATMYTFYHFRLIPPVPLALKTGLVAHEIKKTGDTYEVIYQRSAGRGIWKAYDQRFYYQQGDPVYVFSSVFAPTALKKKIVHRWTWYDKEKDLWQAVDSIGYEITGGRDQGYRGYTFKTNVWPGPWKVEVLTDEDQVLGIIDFEIIPRSVNDSLRLRKKTF